MFFVVSKIVWFVVAPLNAMLFLLIFGLLCGATGWRRTGRAAIWAALVALLLIGFSPLGVLLLRPLEDRFPQPSADFAAPTGIVVLGGSTDEVISDARHQVTIVDAATRVTAAVELARRFPNARLVFSGGSGALLLRQRTEAEDTRQLWISMGVAPGRITTEDQSRNTDENARFTFALINPKADERWLLVTSAAHMPRAMGLFRAVHFPVIPYPVDYRTSGTWADFLIPRDATLGFVRFTIALREWVGLAVYRATGRIGALFPAPG
ncbi:YdcF family protein [Lichenifustis flavocetrariae]|uniref:YdcF family protein n=1 Tax=Lichenifustis flavocetrariae TaxID=2949735 RepID=A0AA41YV21_9HYPH|nr:YdcF family protein [Lichenifustis flavocetrariae]MCW6509104.1 YdcF family protein [Lichenifustis flavocetrariae]